MQPPPPSAPLDCLSCGACCAQRPGTILVTDADVERWAELGRHDIIAGLQPGHFGLRAFPMTEAGVCRYHGLPGQPHACAIYPIRAAVCREFEVGSAQCHEFRRDRGVT